MDNPLPHARKLPKDPKQPNIDPGLDMTIRGWTHSATYTCFFSQAARALSATDPDQPRLQVKLFFGTGSEYYLKRVKTSLPSGAVPINTFVADMTKRAAAQSFFAHFGTTRRCLHRAQLLGWRTKPGEEWHDLLLVEFAWEYLT